MNSQAKMYSRQKPWVESVGKDTEYLICSCGNTQTPPRCDGYSDPGGCEPHRHCSNRDQHLIICGCSRSGSMPFCDGSHNKKPGNTAWKLFLDFLRNPFE